MSEENMSRDANGGSDAFAAMMEAVRERLEVKLTAFTEELVRRLNERCRARASLGELPEMMLRKSGHDCLCYFRRSGHGDWAVGISGGWVRLGEVRWANHTGAFRPSAEFPLEEHDLEELIESIGRNLLELYDFYGKIVADVEGYEPHGFRLVSGD